MATKHDELPAYGNPPQPPQPSYFSPQQGPYSPAQGQGPYSPPQGQGPYSPPQDGGYYGGQQMGYGQQPPPGGYYQQGPYPQGPVPYHQPQQQKKGPGFFEACLAGMACCCCLDLLF